MSLWSRYRSYCAACAVQDYGRISLMWWSFPLWLRVVLAARDGWRHAWWEFEEGLGSK